MPFKKIATGYYYYWHDTNAVRNGSRTFERYIVSDSCIVTSLLPAPCSMLEVANSCTKQVVE